MKNKRKQDELEKERKAKRKKEMTTEEIELNRELNKQSK
jgi:hypothetical protein